jgi:hypothetical protein
VSGAPKVLSYWDDLLPEHLEAPDHAYAQLSEEQLRRLARLARARWLVETGRDSPDGASATEILELSQAFEADGLDADRLLSQREEVRQRRVEQSRPRDIDGRLVTLGGLVLPLDWGTSDHVTRRFLFAPDLSECSHEPPPNHSQVAYIETSDPVDLLPDDSQMVGGDPCIVVTGRVRFSAASSAAYRVDGMMRIDSSYVIEPFTIRCASSHDIARRR